jgi:hypothetical protein
MYNQTDAVLAIVAHIRATINEVGGVVNEQAIAHWVPAENLLTVLLVAERVNVNALRDALPLGAEVQKGSGTTYATEVHIKVVIKQK